MRSVYLSLLFLASFSSFSQTIIFSEDFQNGIPSTFTIIDNDGNTPASAVAEFTSAWISKTDPNSILAKLTFGSTYERYYGNFRKEKPLSEADIFNYKKFSELEISNYLQNLAI